MFTQFLLFTSLAVVAVLGALLLARWRDAPAEPRLPLAPVAVALITAALVALGFLVN